MSILVTGSQGFIGSRLVSLLVENRESYWAVSREGKGYDGNHIGLDLADGKQVQNAMDTFAGCKTIVHCAARLPLGISMSEAAQYNQIIDNNVLALCRTHSAKLVYLSGTSVYGFNIGEADEASKLAPPNEYVAQKLLSENLFQEHCSESVILRVSAPYGPQQVHATVLNIFAKRATEQLPLCFHGDGSREQDFTYIDDVCLAVYKALHANLHDVKNTAILNIASGQAVSMKALAELMVSLVPGCQSSISASGEVEVQPNFKPRINIKRAEELLNWRPQTSLRQGCLEVLRQC